MEEKIYEENRLQRTIEIIEDQLRKNEGHRGNDSKDVMEIRRSC